MLFNSLHFLIFFPIVVAIYFTTPHKYRWILLLISSYYFYMSWKAEYIILIMISTVIDYIAGRKIHKSRSKKRKKYFLTLSILTNIGLLFAFKYFNFFSESLRQLLAQFSIPLNPITLKVLLPVGISFYTFQTLSYTIDVYRGKIKPEKHLGIFAVYVSFFPQLVAGPIERAKNLLPQFFEKHYFEYKSVTDGLKLMLWGFFKKVVIADRLSVIINNVYNNPVDFTGFSLIIATIFFAFQIYCDFSGYSDIAIGSAQIMGFKLMDNFRRPYFSRSISEFWKRWHISLSTWFRDYLYIPLGGNRVSIPRWYLNLFLVFLISGLWHGANWTFVIWGALHGIYLITGILTHNITSKLVQKTYLSRLPKVHNIMRIGLTFVLVNIGWIFFRANSLSDAWYILTHLFSGLSFSFKGVELGVGWDSIIIAIAAILFMETVHIMQEHFRMREFMSNKPIWIRWPIYIILLWLILFFGMFNETQFIYFQF
ncbi:MBOAT family protein [Candidatus Woesearchaeota archaeon]|nr:MBOAT family protein [Candidatus Woesearchaeota archaeon]